MPHGFNSFYSSFTRQPFQIVSLIKINVCNSKNSERNTHLLLGILFHSILVLIEVPGIKNLSSVEFSIPLGITNLFINLILLLVGIAFPFSRAIMQSFCYITSFLSYFSLGKDSLVMLLSIKCFMSIFQLKI